MENIQSFGKVEKRKSSLYKEEHRIAFLFIIVPVIGFVIFALIPFLISLYASFTDWNGIGQMNFIGLENYKNLFQDNYFWQTL